MKNNITKKEIVKNYILGNISSGVYQPHEMIESENTLASMLNISRVTVRVAIDELVNERILIKHHGKGTFLNTFPNFSDFMNGIGFSYEVKRRNMIPSASLLSFEKTNPSIQIKKSLGLNNDQEIVRIKRIRYADDVPVAYEDASFPYNIIGDISEESASGSIYEFLATKGYAFDYADQRINAVSATKDLAKMLDIPEGSPLIEMFVVAYTKQGVPFNAGITYYQTNTFSLVHTIFKK